MVQKSNISMEVRKDDLYLLKSSVALCYFNLFIVAGNVAPPPATAESGVDPMYANDPNVIVVDTNSLPTR